MSEDIARSLLDLSNNMPGKDDEAKKKKMPPVFALIYWLDVHQFNVMSLKKIPAKLHAEGTVGQMKSEKKMWNVKNVKKSCKYRLM